MFVYSPEQVCTGYIPVTFTCNCLFHDYHKLVHYDSRACNTMTHKLCPHIYTCISYVLLYTGKNVSCCLPLWRSTTASLTTSFFRWREVIHIVMYTTCMYMRMLVVTWARVPHRKCCHSCGVSTRGCSPRAYITNVPTFPVSSLGTAQVTTAVAIAMLLHYNSSPPN